MGDNHTDPTVHQPEAVPTASPATAMSRPEARGRASGVAVLAFFAWAWSAWALSDAPPVLQRAVPVPVVVISVALLVLSALLYRRSAAASPDVEVANRGRVGRRFGSVVAGEFIGLVALAVLAGATGHAVAIPAVVCLGVGVHFFPLARLFGVALYTAAGVGLCVAAIAAAVLALATGSDAWWVTVSGFGAAVVLYATSIRLGYVTWRHTRPGPVHTGA